MSDNPDTKSPDSWAVSADADKRIVQAALVAHETAWDWDASIVLTGSEIDEQQPDEWRLTAYLPRAPNDADMAAITGLFANNAPELTTENLPPRDWLTDSQRQVAPIMAGCFHVHTPDYPASTAPGVRNFAIPASQAFGTGHHATTAGCLAMLTHMKRSGVMARDIADIGTGTGLLAFAAMYLWPRAYATASDIDEVCEAVVRDNASANDVVLGEGRGALAMVTAAGMDHPALFARAPYDLLIANILAGPLTELAPDFMDAVADRGHLLLAGLLQTQEAAVRTAYRRAGFRLAKRLVRGDWSILWLRRRPETDARNL
ncbi:MAG: 50S ribosomal protein L11 methyltransferase [Pontixanthobacter sp.]